MDLWVFFYLVSAIMSSAIAYFFFKSVNGWTRKYLIGVFLSLAWVFLIRGTWGWLIYEGIIIDAEYTTLSIIAITPYLLMSTMFLSYLNKQHKRK